MLSVCFLLFNGVFILEAFHAAGRIHNLLLPRDKWMALGTNFYFNIFLGGPGFNNITTHAGNGRFLIFRMNTFFHGLSCPPEFLRPRYCKLSIF